MKTVTYSLAFLSIVALSSVSVCGQAITFDFGDGGNEFAAASAGATMTRDDGNPSNALTINSLEVKAPFFDQNNGDMWDGTTYLDVRTDIQTSGNQLTIDNFLGNSPYSDNQNSFDPGEYWLFDFDKPVIFDEIDFASIDFGGSNNRDDTAIFTIGSSVFEFHQADLNGSDTISDPFGGLVIPAGTAIKVEGGGDPHAASSAASRWRIDEFRVTATTPQSPLVLLVDRGTGLITLKNTSSSPVPLLGYEIDSSIGALDPSKWDAISGNFDDSSNGGDESVDDDDVWTVLTDTQGPYSNDLSEFAFGGVGQGNDGGILAGGQEVEFGLAWFPTPNESDLTAKVADLEGNEVEMSVEYTGDLLKPGDLNRDQSVDSDDWLIFIANDFADDLSEFSTAMTYSMGDLDSDLDIDAADFALFKQYYDADQGMGSFVAMLQGQNVPEPSTVLMLGLAAAVLAGRRLRRLTGCFTVIAVVALGSLSSDASANPIEFLFEADGIFDDSAPIGTTWTLTDNGVFNPVTIELTDARAPMYTNPSGTALEWDGTSHFFPGTAIPGSGGIYINNPGPGNDPSNGGLAPPSDGSGVNEFERFGFSFNRDVIVQAIEFINMDAADGDQAEVSVASLVSPTVMMDSAEDPFGSLVIPANTEILFVGLGSSVPEGDSVWRLKQLTVEEHLPEADRLKARVNSLTGEILLSNPAAEPLSFNSYEFRSSDDALRVGAEFWSGLGGLDSLGPGVGQSWDQGGNSDENFAGERFLLGESTLDPGESVSIGQLFDIENGDISNLSLFYTDTLGHGLDGAVELFNPQNTLGDFNGDGFVNIADYTVWRDNLGAADESSLNGNGSGDGGVGPEDYALWKTNFGQNLGAFATIGSSTQVPEPHSIVQCALLLCGAVCLRGRRWGSSLVPCLLLVFVVASTAQAARSVHGVFPMGDYNEAGFMEFGADNATIGSNLGADADAVDAFGPPYDDLDSSGAPIYHQITSNDAALGHPGPVGNFGIEFDGSDDLLFAGTAFNSITNDVSQGLQLWVFPNQASLQTTLGQSIVFDSANAGGPAISPDGRWTQVSSGHVDLPAMTPVIGDQWYHVAQHIYLSSDDDAPIVVEATGAERDYSSVIYVDGVAVSANNDNDLGGDNVGNFQVGAGFDGTQNLSFFSGVMDEMELYTSMPDEFDLLTDNSYVAQFVEDSYVAAGNSPGTPYEPGDVNLDGDIDQDDVMALVSGWQNEKVLSGAHNDLYVGDLETLQWGDLNIDGRVNLTDAIELHFALLSQPGAVSGFDFSLLTASQVPEPSSWVLISVVSAIGYRWHRVAKLGSIGQRSLA